LLTSSGLELRGGFGVAARPFVAAVLLACVACATTQPAAPPGQLSYVADFDELLRLIDNEYTYRAESGCDTALLRNRLRPSAGAVKSRKELLPVLESALDCLHESHAHFNANLDSSTRLIPSGLQVWAELQDDRALVTQVRHASAAWRAGIRRGDVIVAVDNMFVAAAVKRRMPCCMRGEEPLPQARQWTLLALLAGRHDQPVTLSMSRAGILRQASFTPESNHSIANVESRRNPDGSGYIALNNLGDSDSIAAFDQALAKLRDTSELFLDLRNTPAGGNTDVAEPILGRLINHRQPYQRITPTHGKPWLREVAPGGPWQYSRPVTVLVSRWTGSIGEAMAIGLDGMHRATICGSRMAGLRGSVFDHTLPVSGIVVRLPGERLSHLDGRPRETFVPPLLVADAEAETAPDEHDAWVTSSIAACRRASQQ
jgi:C-terminal processing protease CtpA/Prc